jgi:hypothetical protein
VGFEQIVLRLWAARRFRVPADHELGAPLRAALEPYRARLLAGAAHTLGIEVSMELSGHRDHAVADAEPLFEAVLGELAAQVTAG